MTDYFQLREAADGITAADLERLKVRELLNSESLLPRRTPSVSDPGSTCVVCGRGFDECECKGAA